MDPHVLWQVLKWVLVALAAGFVGQFGRHLAKLILERRRQAKLEAERLQGPQTGAYDVERAKIELEEKRIKEQGKLEKKRTKTELKKAKKASDNRD